MREKIIIIIIYEGASVHVKVQQMVSHRVYDSTSDDGGVEKHITASAVAAAASAASSSLPAFERSEDCD